MEGIIILLLIIIIPGLLLGMLFSYLVNKQQRRCFYQKILTEAISENIFSGYIQTSCNIRLPLHYSGSLKKRCPYCGRKKLEIDDI